MQETIKKFKDEAQVQITNLKKDLSAIRTSRPNPALIEDIEVDVYGQKMTIKQIGSISIVPPRELVITLWDVGNVTQAARGLEDTKKGFNPQVRGNSIHINLPPLSQERRDELGKVAKSSAENIRIQVRSHRDHANKAIDKAEADKAINEDQKFKFREEVQKTVEDANKEIERLVDGKIAELNE
ncbi:MAG: ribosome recycling factor [Candidatus Harrisonbacteria bacterium CG10_big_fil_rev_8_21_14_0_10_44_23]|uniref:Ribosome recycling factor n=1 Tax=Candidatus Harrisonbacteria bacterium CG10_big_fil_rev_8_21_14_0_10_44_23 TaxID=1974585 RepID=A0A2H0UQD6_9BACT|nr:MAG: ribosome recycling factor [Candidatus Harrisonbacteria bacterium CG10_big_fil_rev_8_21_14_0_10_44_23]